MIATRLLIYALICCVLGVTVTGVQDSKNTQARMVERRVHINQPGANESRYAYIPFDVPSHAARISVSYKYDRADGANTIDIGLFDARSTGADTDSHGFRGWSGGRRSEIVVSREEATPGYLPGQMPAGTWRVILGLYKIAPGGVDVSLKIVIETEGNTSSSLTPAARKTDLSSTATSGQRTSLVLPQKVAGTDLRWWRGDLHMHTVHSDGDWTIAELMSSARSIGLDFISITDHNTASHHAEINRLGKSTKQLLVMRGEEITTYAGHTNAWGLPTGTWIDFRVRSGDAARMSSIVAEAHRAGALISINHPFALCGGCAWSYEAAVRDFDAIEVWNGTWDLTDELALMMWDKILQSGRRMTAIASSDSHRSANPIGQPTTHVAANDLSQAALLKAIRQGRVYLTGEAARPVVSFEAEPATGKRRARPLIGDEIRLSAPETIRFFITTETVTPDATVSLISNGQVVRTIPARTDNQPQVIEINCQRDSYFRLEIRDKTKTVIALTNPIYIKVGSSR